MHRYISGRLRFVHRLCGVRPVCVLALFVVAATTSTARAAISVDGALSDWNINVANPSTGWTSPPSGYSTLQTSGRYGGTTPGGGGHAYDAGWMGLALSGNQLFIAIITGQNPQNAALNPHQFGLGDIEFTVISGSNTFTYGLETGGTPNGGDGVVDRGDPGAWFQVDGSGYTISETDYSTGLVAGSIWKAAQPSQWTGGVPSFDPSTQLNPANLGTHVGDAVKYTYKPSASVNDNSVIELQIDLSVFGAGSTLNTVHWGPACGNDFVELSPGIVVTQNTPVPEPGSILIWLLAGTVLALPKWRASRQNIGC